MSLGTMIFIIIETIIVGIFILGYFEIKKK